MCIAVFSVVATLLLYISFLFSRLRPRRRRRRRRLLFHKQNERFQKSLNNNGGPSKVNLCTTKFVDDSKTLGSTEIALPISLPEELKHFTRKGDADMPPGEEGRGGEGGSGFGNRNINKQRLSARWRGHSKQNLLLYTSLLCCPCPHTSTYLQHSRRERKEGEAHVKCKPAHVMHTERTRSHSHPF